MDIEAFLNRTNRSKADLLRELGRDPKSSLISSYIAERAYPPYDVCQKMLLLGITPRELFGEEIDELLKSHYLNSVEPKQPAFDNKEFQEGIDGANKPLTKAEARALFLQMKADGEI